MLRVYALQYERSWDKSLSYVEFSYNNSYQESLKMAPFEMLYGHWCRTPLCLEWDWGTKGFLTQHIARNQEASSHGEREHADCAIKAKEIRRS
jgi:hypothetical protein